MCVCVCVCVCLGAGRVACMRLHRHIIVSTDTRRAVYSVVAAECVELGCVIRTPHSIVSFLKDEISSRARELISRFSEEAGKGDMSKVRESENVQDAF